MAFAHPISNADQAKRLIKEYTAKYHDSRHVCWAYMLGPERKEYQLTDNGEPSGTAGRPILGQINSLGLTDLIVLVVRYFGGIKLGTPGLIAAYKESARMALDEATIIEKYDMARIRVNFPYEAMNSVMKLAKMPGVEASEQEFDNTCSITLSIRRDKSSNLQSRLQNIEGVTAAIE